MMLELWKEIEMEYTNSKIHNFVTVAVTDKNLETRGKGRRMVFHCQGMIATTCKNILIAVHANYFNLYLQSIICANQNICLTVTLYLLVMNTM